MRFFLCLSLYLFIFVLTHVDFSMKNMELSLKKPFADDANVCLIDSATTHTILKILTYFSYLKRQTTSVSTICGNAKLIEGSEIAHIILPKGTKLVIEEALYSEKSQRNLLSFKDIRNNGYHIETKNEGNVGTEIEYQLVKFCKIEVVLVQLDVFRNYWMVQFREISSRVKSPNFGCRAYRAHCVIGHVGVQLG